MLNKLLEQIIIPNESAIKGNIYLPKEIEGKEITWSGSNEDVISTKDQGKLKAGVVKRQSEDVKVNLTASIKDGGDTCSKEFCLTVLKAPKKITEDDYTGYLFGHFIGEQEDNQEQIYFALSEEGLNFKDMNNHKPVLISNIGEKGVRDPFLYRSVYGDRFFLVATDLSIYNRGGWFKNEQGYYDASTTGSSNLVLWQSDDLVNWSEPVLIDVAPKNAGMAWAPEMIYNDETGEYIIFFASSIMDPATKMKAKPNTIFYVATRDFVHYSEPKIFIDNQSDPDGKSREIIDTTAIKVGDYYYSVSKDGDNAEANGGIRILKTKDLLNADSWEKVLNLTDLGLDPRDAGIKEYNNGDLEGPELFVYNKKDRINPDIPEYGIISDRFQADLGYFPIITTNLEDRDNSEQSWKVLSQNEYSFDKLKKRHGTILRITDEEIKRLKNKF